MAYVHVVYILNSKKKHGDDDDTLLCSPTDTRTLLYHISASRRYCMIRMRQTSPSLFYTSPWERRDEQSIGRENRSALYKYKIFNMNTEPETDQDEQLQLIKNKEDIIASCF